VGDAAGIPSGSGVTLSTFNPIPLPNANTSSGGGRALWRINDSGAYTDTSTTCVLQVNGGSSTQADAVRGVKAVSVNSPGGVKIPAGAGLTGRILIQVVDSNGVARDVTTQVLSMGMTE